MRQAEVISRTKTVSSFIDKQSLDNTMLLGYYGGGNFGDELLLEVLSAHIKAKGSKNITVMYRDRNNYAQYHRDFGFNVAESSSKTALIKQFWRSKNIVIGGGGLWGLDVNPNIFLLSGALFFAHFVLRKHVYLLGVGYYSSTSKLGHFSAWLAAKASREILARDDESYYAFSRLNPRTYLCDDIALSINSSLIGQYEQEGNKISAEAQVSNQTIFVAIRHFRDGREEMLLNLFEQLVRDYPNRRFIFTMLQPADSFNQGKEFLDRINKVYANVYVLSSTRNPMAIVGFLSQHKHQLIIIAPQFHIILTAIILGIPFMPLSYDNKVGELIRSKTKLIPLNLSSCSRASIDNFLEPLLV